MAKKQPVKLPAKVVDRKGIELERPVWMSEQEWMKMSEDQKEFGTPSSPKARHEESEWIPNPDLDRATRPNTSRDPAHYTWESMNPKVAESELRTRAGYLDVARRYGITVDARLDTDTITRVVQSGMSMYRRERRVQAHMRHMRRKEIARRIVAGVILAGLVAVITAAALGAI